MTREITNPWDTQDALDKAVEDGTVLPGKDAELGLEVDKYWTSPVDGAKLAVILSKIGLRQQ